LVKEEIANAPLTEIPTSSLPATYPVQKRKSAISENVCTVCLRPLVDHTFSHDYFFSVFLLLFSFISFYA
jgi:hypothetical protein